MTHDYKTNAWTFVSFVMGFRYTVGEEYTVDKFPNVLGDYTLLRERKRDGFYFITREGFYSWASMGTALEELKTFCWKGDKKAIVRCVIPKGTRYYIDGDGSTYCSEKIRIEAYYRKSKRVWVKENMEILPEIAE